MGDELVSDSLSPDETDKGGIENEQSALNYSDMFWKCLPVYLAMGMTSDEYWNGDCKLTEAYREAYKIKNERKNLELWLQGLYIYDAIGRLAPALNSGTPKGTKIKHYVEQPYPLTEEEAKRHKEEEERKRQENMRERILENAKLIALRKQIKENENKKEE